MAHRSTNVIFALLVTIMLPIGFALAQGGGATSPGGNETVGGVVGGYSGVGNPSPVGAGNALSPPITGQSSPTVPVEVQGISEQPASSPTGLAKSSEDGVSTKIVPARPCSTAARETDGTTTCVGIPDGSAIAKSRR
jgi:hypothetical protein